MGVRGVAESGRACARLLELLAFSVYTVIQNDIEDLTPNDEVISWH